MDNKVVKKLNYLFHKLKYDYVLTTYNNEIKIVIYLNNE